MAGKRVQLLLDGPVTVQTSGRIFHSPRSGDDFPVIAEGVSVRRAKPSRVMLLEPGRYLYLFDSSGHGRFYLSADDIDDDELTSTWGDFSAPGLANVFRFRVRA